MGDSRPGAQPQYSPDGRWWWTGSQWIPVAPGATGKGSSPQGGVPAWLAIPSLVFCFPLGVVLTWLTRWSTTVKIIASASAALLWLAAFSGLAVASLQLHTTGGTSTATASPLSTSGPTPSTPARPTQSGQPAAGNITVVHSAQALKLVTSRNGEFSIAIPAGWVINPSQDSQNFTITPAGASEPSIGIEAAIPVSDLRATEVALNCAQNPGADVLSCASTELSYQLQDSQREWSAADAFQALTQFLTKVANVQFGTPNIRQLSQTSANYEVIKQDGQASLDDWGVIAMGYMNNPVFRVSTSPAYTSLAFVTGCEAPAGQTSGMRAICSQALASFRPSQSWLQSLAQHQMQAYQSELAIIQQQLANDQQFQQMVNRFRSDMQQMQIEEFKAMQAVDQRVGDDWLAALGGKVNMKDQDGYVYLLDNGYQSYCKTSTSGVFWESNGYLRVGQSAGGYTCEELLKGR